MPKFIPEPYYPEEWWKSIEVFNIIAFDNEMCFSNSLTDEKPGKWMAFAVYAGEPFPPSLGYRVLFPTATDCLYWIRWLVLPEECNKDNIQEREYILLTGKAKEIADIIDNSADGVSSANVIKMVRESVIHDLENEGKAIYFIGTFEECFENFMDQIQLEDYLISYLS